jgi:hypothetical protein
MCYFNEMPLLACDFWVLLREKEKVVHYFYEIFKFFV